MFGQTSAGRAEKASGKRDQEAWIQGCLVLRRVTCAQDSPRARLGLFEHTSGTATLCMAPRLSPSPTPSPDPSFRGVTPLPDGLKYGERQLESHVGLAAAQQSPASFVGAYTQHAELAAAAWE